MLATKPFGGLRTPLAVARSLAMWENCDLRVVSVLEEIGTGAKGATLPARYYDEERAALAALIQRELTGDDAGPTGIRVDVLEGPSACTVVDKARECGARLIVVGTGCHDSIVRYIYGERALKIIAIADRPVLVVPDRVETSQPSVAVVAVDFSPASVRAAHAVLPMLPSGARLIIVHVKPGVTLNEENAGWWNDAYERRCAERFEQVLRQLPKPPGVTFAWKFLRGDIVSNVVTYAAMQGAGVIACGRLGHSLVERVFVGSVSSSLIRRATCPVLVAPELPSDAAWR